MTHSHLYTDLIDPQRILAIEAGAIPSPANGRPPTKHLFVNCAYHAYLDDQDPGELLEAARSDVARIIKRSSECGAFDEFPSICVSILGRFRSGAARRIYRYAVESKSVPLDANVADERALCALPGSLHSSEVDAIELLLNQPVA